MEGGGVWTVLFSEVTQFEYNVPTTLSPIVALTLSISAPLSSSRRHANVLEQKKAFT